MHQKYLTQLNEIWQQEEYCANPFISTFIKRGYAFPEIEKADILFIGLNPAGREEKGPSFPYNLEKAVKDLPNFYGRYNQLAQRVGASWTYTDLFYFKETDSSVIEQMLQSPLAVQFLVEQLRITQALIEEIAPKVIVVFNAKARKFFGLEQNLDKNEGIWMGYRANDQELYEKFGTPVITEVNSDIERAFCHQVYPPLPILFDNFITYQSKGPIDRLIWHLKFILKKLDSIHHEIL